MAKPARTKYRRLRSRMHDAGFTVESWALSLGFIPSTAYDALKGNRNGLKSREIQRKAMEVFGA